MGFDPTDNHIIFKTIAGSTLYGLQGPDSDTDYRGVYLPDYTTLMSPFKKTETKIDHSGDDEELHSLGKVISLAAQCNPNIIELLFVPDRFIVKTTPTWEIVRENRELFLSKEAEFRFKGYAVSQMHRVCLHKKYLDNPIISKPTREEFGLVAGKEIKKDQFQAFMSILDKNTFGQIPTWNELTREERGLIFDEIAGICVLYADNLGLIPLGDEERYSYDIETDIKLQNAKNLGFSDDFIEVAKREKKYYSALSQYNSYQTRKKDRNPKRAELEAKFGYDAKHVSHTMRLLHMALEIGEGKGVIPDRRGIDDDFLKSIKFEGAMKYDDILGYVETLKNKITAAFKASNLPQQSDRKKLEEIYLKAVQTYYGK